MSAYPMQLENPHFLPKWLFTLGEGGFFKNRSGIMPGSAQTHAYIHAIHVHRHIHSRHSRTYTDRQTDTHTHTRARTHTRTQTHTPGGTPIYFGWGCAAGFEKVLPFTRPNFANFVTPYQTKNAQLFLISVL